MHDTLTNTLGMTFRRIQAGSFLMGTDGAEVDDLLERIPGDPDFHAAVATESPSRRVRITSDYYMGAGPVTIREFRTFVEGTRHETLAETRAPGAYLFTSDDDDHRKPTHGTWHDAAAAVGDDHPVTCVAVPDVSAFLAWLESTHPPPAGWTYRLPTEAEWEFAARGPAGRRYPWGDAWRVGACNFADLSTGRTFSGRGVAAPHEDNGFPTTNPVGALPSGNTPDGLADMAGNVFEWCLDGYLPDAYARAGECDPVNLEARESRVIRGGSWLCFPERCRAAYRNRKDAAFSSNYVGFRIATCRIP